ncbi:MAG: tetratricopeptide repeat protein [Elusimicrobia bacterium]|nr:tetratricopeptide repeat protein [Elusimicrobiota bacterium]
MMLRRIAVTGAAFLILAVAAWRLPPSIGAGNLGDTSYGEEGRALRYGLPAELNHLPLASVSAALLFEPGEAPGPRSGRMAAAWSVWVLTVALGGLLAGPWGAAAAGIVLSAAASEWTGFNLPQTGLSVLILSAAGLMVWRSHGPGLGRTILLALGLGACLLYRSSMSFFPPVLGLWVAMAAKAGPSQGRRPLRRAWLHGAVLCLAPYVLLIPWTWAQRAAGNGIVLFERGQARSNFAVGALGMPFCIEGEWRSFLPDPGPDGDRGERVWGWGLSEIGRHPGRTAAAVWTRIAFVIGLHPWLVALAGAAVWLGRRRPGVLETALLAACFVGVHVVMAVKDDYFRPLWPVLAALTAGGAVVPPCGTVPSCERLEGDEAGGRAPPAPSGNAWAAGGALWAAAPLLALALAAALVGYAQSALVRHALRVKTVFPEEVVAAALSRRSGDPWLWAKHGEARLDAGDTAGAAEAFSRATALRPGQPRWTLLRAWLKALSGSGRELDGMTFDPRDAGLDTRLDLHLLKAHAALRSGRRADMRRQLVLAVELQDRDFTRLTMAAKPVSEDVLSMMRPQAPEILNRLHANLGGLPASERLAMLEVLSELRPSHCGYLLQAAGAAAESGRRGRALAALSRAEARCGRVDDRRRVARTYHALKESRRALALCEAVARRRPERAGVWVECAETAAGAKESKAAQVALRRAEALSPSEEELRRIASVHRMLGAAGRAFELSGALARRNPDRAAPWVEFAAAGAAVGRRKEALEGLDRAEALHPAEDELALMAATYRALGEHGQAMRLYRGLMSRRPLAKEERHKVALTYQALGEHGLCLRGLEDLTRDHPREAQFWSDRGVCALLSGEKAAAMRHFGKALELDPWFLPAVWSRGSILAAEGRPEEASRLYDRALSRPTPERWAELRARIEAGRKALRSPGTP